MQTAYGIDCSNYAGDLSPEQLQGLVDAGVTFCVVEYTYHDLFVRQCRALAGAGIKVSSYFFFYWSRATSELARLGEIITCLQGEMADVQFGWLRPDNTYAPALWIDCEEDPDGSVDVATTCAYIGEAVELCGAHSVPCGIYTAEYWWKARTNNWTGLAGFPLWHASQFQLTVPIPFARYYQGHEYGSWPQPQLWQHRSTSNVGGVSVDGDLEEWAE